MSRNNNTDGTNSPYKLLLNDIKAYRWKLCKALGYNFPSNINSLNTQISKKKQLTEFLGTRLGFTNNLAVFNENFRTSP